MDLQKLLTAIRNRTPWPVARRALLAANLGVKRGWENTIEGILELEHLPEGSLASLASFYNEHVLIGEKSVFLYELESDVLSSIQGAFADISLEECQATKSFPLPLAPSQLKKTKKGHKLVHTESQANGFAAVFSHVWDIEERTELSPSLISSDGGQVFDSVIGFRREKMQGFDVIWLPNDGTVMEIRIDVPYNRVIEMAPKAHADILKNISTISQLEFELQPNNLFGCIERLYKMKEEGRVVELAFSTQTASIKHEKMRRQNDVCLREETFHKAGSEAIGDQITPYKIAIEWSEEADDGTVSSPELLLHGYQRQTLEVNPVTTEARIKNCSNRESFNRIVQLLASDN